VPGVGPVKEGQGENIPARYNCREKVLSGNELGTSMGKSCMRYDQRDRSKFLLGLKGSSKDLDFSQRGGGEHKNFLIVMT